MTPARPREIDIRREDIPGARAWDDASRGLAGLGALASAGYLAGLAIEELATNCLRYGHDDPRGYQLAVRVEYADGELWLRAEDDGAPVQPGGPGGPDLTLPAGARPLGGLGLHRRRWMSDRREYHRVGGTSCACPGRIRPPLGPGRMPPDDGAGCRGRPWLGGAKDARGPFPSFPGAPIFGGMPG